MAACDASMKFTMINVGAEGGQFEGAVFRNSGFGRLILEKTLNIPHPKCLPGTSKIFPHYFVADAAFPLLENFVRPYPGLQLLNGKENFNNRLSRARRTIENAFGILAARWRILLTTIHMKPSNAVAIVLATICLHNFIMNDTSSQVEYCPPNYADAFTNEDVIEGQWREEIVPLSSVNRISSNRSSTESSNLRNTLCNYLNTTGRIPWGNNIKEQ